MKDRCDKIELHQKKHDTCRIYKEIKNVTHFNRNQQLLEMLNRNNEVV